ncbi:MAG: TonB-dependent receptor [Ignavibacteria bacterium]|nr:MAG: TonB-dependent receptor [Ignavibacteria bacterium]
MPRFQRCSTILATLLFAAGTLMAQGNKIEGKVTDENGSAIPFANVLVEGTRLGATANLSGEFVIINVPPGTYTLAASAIGYKKSTASVTVAAGQPAKQDFTLAEDVLRLQEIVVAGSLTPRGKQDASVAISTLAPAELERASPRSSTEVLRYVPGFTRVESSGGEVNQNITVRGILGVEYVMFMEDGMPVFPTMHSFFMNADNLFRPDENIASVEVVRGGSSALFGSNTPGAIVNFVTKSGGPQIGGSLKTSVGTEGLARYDFNLNGPLAEEWRFNLGGFYRYDHGVRDPGFPGIRGGQVKANITRLLDNGYIRVSAKIIDDRNQFILPLPFHNPSDPQYVSGFSDYGSMNTNEGNDLRVATPTGDLQLHLDDGLRTKASWLTGEVGFNFPDQWNFQNTAQIMQDDQAWNAIVPFDIMPAADWVKSLGLPPAATYRLFYTNHFDGLGNRLPFSTPNGLVAPSGLWHVEKPLSAFQDQLTLNKTVDKHKFTLGLYFANYSQVNHWYFTDILTDVEDNPRFLDLEYTVGAAKFERTKNGFRNFLSLYVNGAGQTTVVSGVAGAELQLTDQLRADIGARYEADDFVQSAENSSTFDLDKDTATLYDREDFGNGSFRHFSRKMEDWAGSLGLNYRVSDELSVYAQGSRAFKMPALDEFLTAQAEEKVGLFDARQVYFGEGGIKYAGRRVGLAADAFYGLLKNIIGQGAVTDSTGKIIWTVSTSPENRAYGLELEVSSTPAEGFSILGSGTFLKAELGTGAGADIGSWLNGVPSAIGNLSATYMTSGVSFMGDWHYVSSRFSDAKAGNELPAYSYFNFGLGYTFPGQAISLSADMLNAFQSKGLEEGNPRLALVGGKNSDLFLARPLLPRRFMLAAHYRF